MFETSLIAIPKELYIHKSFVGHGKHMDEHGKRMDEHGKHVDEKESKTEEKATTTCDVAKLSNDDLDRHILECRRERIGRRRLRQVLYHLADESYMHCRNHHSITVDVVDRLCYLARCTDDEELIEWASNITGQDFDPRCCTLWGCERPDENKGPLVKEIDQDLCDTLINMTWLHN
jgi:hypothetical protein